MIAAISGPGPMMLMGVRYVLEGGVRKRGAGCVSAASWSTQPPARISGPTALLHIGDNQMVFESVARLNAVEPSKVGQSGLVE